MSQDNPGGGRGSVPQWGDSVSQPQGQGYAPAPQPMQPYQQQQAYPQHGHGYPQAGYAQQPYQPGYYQAPPAPMQQVVVVQQNAGMVYMKAPFNHTVHIIVDIFTCGAWIPIHLILWAAH